MVVGHQNQLAKCPNDAQCPQAVLNSRQVSEPLGKMPKWHLVPTHSSQYHAHIRTKWQECPNSTSYSQMGRLPSTHQWTYPILELVTSSPVHVSIPPMKSVGWQLVPTGEKQGGSSKQMVLAAARKVPQIPFSEPASHEQQAHTLSWPWETQESQVSKHTSCSSQPHAGWQKTYWNWGSCWSLSKAYKATRLVERKVCLSLDASNLEGMEGRHLSKSRLPPTPRHNEIRGQELL